MKLSMPRAICFAFALFLLAGFVSIASAASNNYSDIWWNPAESGWGLTIADHETQLFAVWYTYDSNGKPTWFVIPGGTLSSDKRTFSGDIYRTTGPAYTSPSFNPNLVTATKVGTMSLDFAPAGMAAGNALFTYSLDGVNGSKVIQRQPFGNAAPSWGTDFTDIWWNSNESGWGLTLAQHGDNVFGVWYTYDTDGQPLWVVFPGVTFITPTIFRANAYTTTGPWFGAAVFNPGAVVATAAGSFTFTFDPVSTTAMKASAPWRGRWAGTFRGSAQNRTFTPQPFGQSTAAGSCSGSFEANLTGMLFGGGYGCDNLTPYSFTGHISIAGIDWTRVGSQQAAINLTPGGFICNASGNAPLPRERSPFDAFLTPTLELSRNVNSIVGHGTGGDTNTQFVIDFSVPGGTLTTGTLSFRHAEPPYVNWQWSGTFSCTPPQ